MILNQFVKVKLENVSLTSGEVAERLAAGWGVCCFRPLNEDSHGLFSCGVHGVSEFVGWNGSSAARRNFAVNIEGDAYLLLAEYGAHQVVATGMTRHTVEPGTALLTSVDRYSGLDIGAGSVAEGFSVPRDAVARALAATFERPVPSNFEFTPLLDLSNGPAAYLLKLMRFFRDDICVDQALAVSSIALSNFQEMFCMLMVQNLRHTLSNCKYPSSSIAPRQVKRALEFAREHAGMPITISDMAVAAGVSVRALQLNFQRFLNMTPMAYLRQLRLENVRRDLLAADPLSTVTEIARRWGFVHLTRFSRAYFAAFGVMPSSDLRSRNDLR
jgi:AraC-like DNA-binding protein